jgi:uncharacterized protein YciI
MKTFFCKLIAPRATFAQDMSAAEAQIMQEHAAYWRGWMDRGHVVAFGLVADPRGVFGIGIVEVEDEADVRSLKANDPTIKANVGFAFEVHPMPRGVLKP